ncbi:MAG: carboxypeptidase regulatory-like domain-containing protein [Candidatus Acidiferrum sp.]|jgi:tetratricopeptide (TPR) repeat protein
MLRSKDLLRLRSFNSLFSLIVLAALAGPSPAAQEATPPASKPAAETGVIGGTVRDATGNLVSGATVTLYFTSSDSARSTGTSIRTDARGAFTFVGMRAGRFLLRAEASESRASQVLDLAAAEKKHVDLVLTAQSSAAPGESAKGNSAANALQFADQPNFTVAGMTDWSNLGLHGSDATARTSEALTRETLALKPGKAGENGGSAAAAHRLAGDQDEKLGDPVAAVHEYETATRLGASEENYFAWGSELLLHRAAQPAAEVFAKGAAAYPDSARMLAGLGAALYASGSLEEAARKLCAAADLSPADDAPYLFLGQMEETATAPIACSEEKLGRFAQQQPGNALADYYYALSLTKRERVAGGADGFHEIERLLEKSAALDPKLGEAHLQLGILYSEQGDFVRATGALQKAVAAKPELGLAHYRLGQAYKRTGEEAKAQQEFALYAQCEKSAADARERERRELRQFLVILKDAPPSLPQ